MTCPPATAAIRSSTTAPETAAAKLRMPIHVLRLRRISKSLADRIGKLEMADVLRRARAIAGQFVGRLVRIAVQNLRGRSRESHKRRRVDAVGEIQPHWPYRRLVAN